MWATMMINASFGNEKNYSISNWHIDLKYISRYDRQLTSHLLKLAY